MQRNYSRQHLNFQKNYFVFKKIFDYSTGEEVWTGGWERHEVGPLTQRQAFEVEKWWEGLYGKGSAYRITMSRLTNFIKQN